MPARIQGPWGRNAFFPRNSTSTVFDSEPVIRSARITITSPFFILSSSVNIVDGSMLFDGIRLILLFGSSFFRYFMNRLLLFIQIIIFSLFLIWRWLLIALIISMLPMCALIMTDPVFLVVWMTNRSCELSTGITSLISSLFCHDKSWSRKLLQKRLICLRVERCGRLMLLTAANCLRLSRYCFDTFRTEGLSIHTVSAINQMIVCEKCLPRCVWHHNTKSIPKPKVLSGLLCQFVRIFIEYYLLVSLVYRCGVYYRTYMTILFKKSECRHLCRRFLLDVKLPTVKCRSVCVLLWN